MTKEPERIYDESPSAKNVDADLAAATAPTREKQSGQTDSATLPQSITEEVVAPLFHDPEAEGLRSRWQGIQAGFVDQPRQSVEDADQLVVTVINRLSEVFAVEREKLEQGWASGDDVSTEDLRVALRRYRTFFDRLLSV